VVLPVLNAKGKKVGTSFEQTTYLEWVNSAYSTEKPAGKDPRSCQSCHMAAHYDR